MAVSPWKSLLRSEGLRRFLCWAGSGYIRLVHASGPWEVVGAHIPAAFWESGRPFILCFWHGRLLMMPYCWRRGRPIHMLISSHPDGQLIARTVGHFGIETVAGSSTRGGAQGMRSLIRLLKRGESVGITPDGPRGPRMRAGLGAVALARLSGAPLVPCSYSTTRRRLARSWDRFVVALPGGRGVIAWGEPIAVPSDADEPALEAARQRLEDALNAITAEADRRAGHVPVAPASAEAGAGVEAARP